MARKRIATFLAVGKGLSILGDHCYAASGETTDAASGGANTTLFDFTTGDYYVTAIIDMVQDMTANNLTFLELSYNGINVIAFENDVESHFAEQPVKLDVIIPPHTSVKFKWGANSSTEGYAFLSGRIYNA